MDEKIIAALKKLYKMDLLGVCVNSLECAERLQRQAMALTRPRGMVVSVKGHQLHVAEAIELMNKARDRVAPRIIKRHAG